MEQKTFHKQTGKFLGVIAENMPEIPVDIMQGWIQNPKALQKALGEALMPSMITNRLKKVTSSIDLEAIESFKLDYFFKTKDQGGVFAYVDSDIFNWFDNEVKNSLGLTLANYEFTEDITEQSIINDAKAGNIYIEVTLAHVMQICTRHIIDGENLLKDNSQANLFWVRNKKGDLCKAYVNRDDDGWNVNVDDFYPDNGWDAGYGSFFSN